MANDFKLGAIREVPSIKEEDGGHSPEAHSPRDSGQARLHALGYRQELRRTFGVFASFATGLVLMGNCGSITGVIQTSSHCSVTGSHACCSCIIPCAVQQVG